MEVALAAVVGVTVVANIGSSGLIVSAGSNTSRSQLIQELITSNSISESGLSSTVISGNAVSPHGASRVSHFPHPLSR